VEVIPLGLIPGIQYLPNAVPLRHGDLLILHTDGISESTNEGGEELGYEGLMHLARNLPVQTVNSPGTVGQVLLSALEAFSEDSPTSDDQSLVGLLRTADDMTSNLN
jgi:serine phosphatase RsbU (regulator of sigma subunit)